jgi:PAS domain S-box-containing protein
MDNQTQSFLELSAKNDLVQLVADKRAAWLWSADGAHILWANAAGASFFSVQSASELAGLTALERSPARPHIARIATTGQTDKFSIDRLRFYRGLRVMLLTCQCKRIDLENGDTAALIVCGDKGLSTTKDPVESFAQLVQTSGQTAFVMAGSKVQRRVGKLEGVPEELDLPEGQSALFGPLELDGEFHEGALIQFPDDQKLIVLSDDVLSDELTEEPQEIDTPVAPPALTSTLTEAAETPEPVEPDPVETEPDETDIEPSDEIQSLEVSAEVGQTGSSIGETDAEENREEASLWVRADSEDLDSDNPDRNADQNIENGLGDFADVEVPGDDDSHEEIVQETVQESAAVEDDLESDEVASASEKIDQDEDPAYEQVEPETETTAEFDEPTNSEEAKEGLSDSDETGDDLAETATTAEEAFVFQPRRRPVRFAWKMDIDQRFTFLSDEFSEVLGPLATDIVGLTWEEVSSQFGLDPKGNIARALDRRDTWSGRTVDWPVSGAPLRVPVDMAALPAFDRNRKFEGYRGFGVCRTADAIDAPEVLVLSPALAAFDEALAAEPAPETPETPEEPAEAEVQNELASHVPEDFGETDADTSLTADLPIEDAVDEIPAEDKTEPEHPEAEAEPELASEAQETVEDLKPAQPDTFSGRTFLGASAAALVGSLARFTGKSGSDPVEKTDTPEDDEKPDALEDTGTKPDETEFVGAALDQKLEELEAGKDTGTETGDLGQDNKNEQGASLGAEEDDEPRGAEAQDTANTLDPAPHEAAAEDAEPTSTEEPVGINGPAELKPAEIESAVKSLAKSYNASEKKAPDLFDEKSEGLKDTQETSISEEEPISEIQTDKQDNDHSDEATEAEISGDNENQESIDEIEKPESSSDLPLDDEKEVSDESLSEDEREFFEETAAFEHEDQIAEATDNDTKEPPEQMTGKVIPLATARPRVVPVDTSGLSRPERQAFRKIAEALGARLEGDLGDFEASDPEIEAIDELPPEVPEAGPIDPSLLDRLPIGISIVRDREVLYANKALLKLLGYNSTKALSEAGGLEALFIDETEDLPYGIGLEDEVDETMKVRLADGGVLNVDAHMHSVPWNEGQGLMISVTERTIKPSAAALEAPASPNFFAEVREELEGARNQIAEMDTILETATDGVLVLDQHGSIVKVNGSAEALFSANRSDMIGEPFTEFLAPESHRAAADYLDGLSRNGVASILNDGREVLGKVPTGGLIPLFMTMGRITSGKNDAKYCAVLRDITQWKTAEEELTQAKRQAENASSQKSDFLAKISHEIRTPLNAIIGFSEVMMEERFGPIGNDRYKDYLKDIRTSGSHIMSLINDLLDLSKIEAGKLDLNFSAVSTNDVINECVALMQPQANRERVIIRASLPESVPDVVADPRSLRQIILNLLSNAIKYNRSAGQVILSTALESNGEVILRVRDTGTGMTAKQLAAALEPFRQLHTASRGGGTGLGLPLTKALVEANRASFHIDSTPDQGTLVEIIFPTQRVLSE